MTSLIDSPRSCRAELSPITQRTASMMLDLPQPLGPTTAVMLEGKGTVVGSTKDLKPASLIDLSRISGVVLLLVHSFAPRCVRMNFRRESLSQPWPAKTCRKNDALI